jgi:NADH-ubiquinone oxidoreductase chain 4L
MNLSLFLFLIGILGFILNRKNLILLIISIEIMLLAVTLLILISSFGFDDNIGQTFAIYIIAIAGAESVIGLSILVAYYRLILALLYNKHFYFIKEGFWGLSNSTFKTCTLITIPNLTKTGFEERGELSVNNNNNRHVPRSHSTLRGEVLNLNLFKSIFKLNILCTQIGINARYNIKTIRYLATWSGMSKKERESQYVYPKSRVISLGSNTLQKIESNPICKSIVVHGQCQGSTLGFRLSQNILNNIFLTKEQLEIIIGIMLGDAYIHKKSVNGNALIQFNQGFVHLPYVLFLMQKLAPLCTHYPLLIQSRDASFSLKIYTRCLLSLNPIFDLFIVNGKKTISPNIVNSISARSLAFWAMDDGSLSESCFYFNTLSYSIEEHLILQKKLKSKFNLETSVHKHGNKYKLYIKAKSMPIFRFIVYPYFIESFYYKLYPNSINNTSYRHSKQWVIPITFN